MVPGTMRYRVALPDLVDACEETIAAAVVGIKDRIVSLFYSKSTPIKHYLVREILLHQRQPCPFQTLWRKKRRREAG